MGEVVETMQAAKRAKKECPVKPRPPFPPPTFDAYYRELATDDADHAALQAAMCRPLPTAFRSAGDAAAVGATAAELRGKFGELPQLHELGWHEDAWKLVCSRQELREIPQLASLHKWLVGRHEAGAVRRQEEASMLSVALLGALPGERIVDMCASPGSKSSELADLVGPTGLLIANDNDLKRCWMLMHTMRRFPRPALVVTHHEAQNLPPLPGGVGFDKVLCDVPCSGDGTLRKARSHWERKGWKPTLGVSLQPLQLAIARRGLQLLRKGGHLLYSTCSLNPAENEAVVAALLAEGGCELVDAHEKLPGLTLRKGLTTWRVANGDHPHWRQGVPGRGSADAAIWFETAAEAKAVDGPSANRLASPHLYPPESESVAAQLPRCARLLPQDNDTGGFFAALFVKTADYDPEAATANAKSGAISAAEVKDSDEKDVVKKEGKLRSGGATSKNSNIPSHLISGAVQAMAGGASGDSGGDSGSAEALVVADARFPDEMSTLRKFYGLPDFEAAAAASAQDVLLTRSAEAGLHRIFWVSAPAAELVVLSKVFTVVGAGTSVFELTRARGAACDYRLCSDAAAVWASGSVGVGADAGLGGRMIWLGKKAWAALLHGPGSGTEAAMPLSVLTDAAAGDEAVGVSGSGGAGVEALGSVGAGCLLLRLAGEGKSPSQSCRCLSEL